MSNGDEVFNESDLEPNPTERRTRWLDTIDRIAALVAAAAAGLWGGGLLALGVYGGVEVFDALPKSLAAEAQASALSSFDVVGLGCAAVVLACEMARSALAFRRRRTVVGRVRRIAALSLAACAAYLALLIAPGVLQLRSAGVVPGLGAHGEELARLERGGLRVRQAEIPLATLLMVLQMWTLRSRRDDDDDAQSTSGPLLPGPGSVRIINEKTNPKAVKRYLDDADETNDPLPPS
jgi:hypothetical protein